MDNLSHAKIADRNTAFLSGGSFTIDPGNLGFKETVRVCVFDSALKTMAAFILDEGNVLAIQNDIQKTKLRYKIQVKTDGKWLDATKYVGILPPNFQANPPGYIGQFPGELQVTLRKNVVLSPYRSLHRKSPPWGHIAAYENHAFIPEAHRVVMGKQAYLTGPEPLATKDLRGSYIFGDCLGGAYGHVITEGISRLWYAKINPDFPIIWIRGTELLPIHKRILEFLEIKNEHIFLSEPVRVENCIFPVPALCIGDFVSPGYFDFVGVEDPQAPQMSKKIFISRSKLDTPGRLQSEAAALDRMMLRFGFELFFPEQHDLKEQLEIISSAEIVSGVEGSAFHSLVFYRHAPKTRFVVLGRHRMGGGIYSQIKQGKALNYLTLNVIGTSEHTKLNARSEVAINMELLESLLSSTNGFEDIEEIPNTLLCNNEQIAQPVYLDMVKMFPNKMTNHQAEIVRIISDIDSMSRHEVLEKLGELLSAVS